VNPKGPRGRRGLFVGPVVGSVTFLRPWLRLIVGKGSTGKKGSSIIGGVELLTGPDVGLRVGVVSKGLKVVCADGTEGSVTFLRLWSRLIVG
jgi:hypothetical protein